MNKNSATTIPLVREGINLNHNETALKNVNMGITIMIGGNHNETMLKLVREGINLNHNQTVLKIK